MKIKVMKWKATPIDFGKNQWAYRSKNSITFLNTNKSGNIQITVPLKFLNKILAAK